MFIILAKNGQSEGYKNVTLGNVLQTSYNVYKKATFVSQADHELFEKFLVTVGNMMTGLHELFGHGSGKLLRETNGRLNYCKGLLNPLTGKPVDKHYKKGETFASKFTSLASTYEECRAECISLYLCRYDDVLK
jgi:dipeptidyl-peptidase-3